MKIRINGDTIRLRLSQTEVADIGVLTPISRTTHIGNNKLVYCLVTHEGVDSVKASYLNNEIRISVNSVLVKQWANSDDVGLSSNPNFIPSILIEKDFQCLTVREGEDESDLFTNPNTNC